MLGSFLMREVLWIELSMGWIIAQKHPCLKDILLEVHPNQFTKIIHELNIHVIRQIKKKKLCDMCSHFYKKKGQKKQKFSPYARNFKFRNTNKTSYSVEWSRSKVSDLQETSLILPEAKYKYWIPAKTENEIKKKKKMSSVSTFDDTHTPYCSTISVSKFLILR